MIVLMINDIFIVGKFYEIKIMVKNNNLKLNNKFKKVVVLVLLLINVIKFSKINFKMVIVFMLLLF